MFKTPIEIFKETVKNYPKKNAIRYFENGEWIAMTYEAFDKKTNALANYLYEIGLRKGDVVGVCFPPGIYYLLCMMACWKSGLVYMPMMITKDINQTIDKINSRLTESHSHCFISSNEYSDLFTQINIPPILIESLPLEQQELNFSPPELHEQDAAYIICSSGTTGKPKMILTPFEGIMDRIVDTVARMKIDSNERVLALLDFEFDASMMEVLLAFASGGELIIAPQEYRNFTRGLSELFQEASANEFPISTTILLPGILKSSLKNGLIDPNDFPGLKKILPTGEACNAAILEPFLNKGIRVWNGYGPTESTFGASLTEIKLGEGIYIDAFFDGLEPQLVNHEESEGLSELFLSGNGICSYLNNEALNQKHFIEPERAAEFGLPYKRWYRTYDLVQRVNERMVYKYRYDRVVKRSDGTQVSLDDIEHELKEKCGVDSVVVERKGQIISFIITSDEVTIDQSQLLSKHRSSVFYTLPEYPYNKLGKSIKKYDDLMRLNPKKIKTRRTEELNKNESIIADIWEERFPGAEISKDDDFSSFGANSLDRHEMIGNVWSRFIDTLNPVEHSFSRFIVNNPTIKAIAKFISIYQKQFIFPISSKREDHAKAIHFGSTYFDLENVSESDHYVIETSEEIQDCLSMLTTSCLKQLRQIQPTGPYHLILNDNTFEALVGELEEKLQKQGEKVFVTKLCKHENDFVDHCRRIISLQYLYTALHKIKKHQDKLFIKQQSQLPSHEIIQQVDSFAKDNNQITWLLGDGRTGKSAAAKWLADRLWQEWNDPENTLSKNGEFFIPIVLSLKNKNTIDLQTLHLSEKELNELKKFPVLFIFEDYELFPRLDFPNLIQNKNFAEFSNAKFLITCRQQYLQDKRIWEKWQLHAEDQIIIPSTINILDQFQNTDERYQFLKYWFAFEYKRHYGEKQNLEEAFSEFMLALHAFAKQYDHISSLNCHISPWEVFPSITTPQQNKYFNFIRELLIKEEIPRSQLNTIEDESDGISFLSVPVRWKFCLPDSWREDLRADKFLEKLSYEQARSSYYFPPSLEMNPSSFGSNKSDSLIVMNNNPLSIPIFAFSPLTGDTPEAYRKLSQSLGPHQAFYILQMSQCEDGQNDRTTSLDQKAQYYSQIIQTIAPRGSVILLGWSFGAVTAYATAQQLEQNGRDVPLVVNIDCPAPQDFRLYSAEEMAFNIIKVLIGEVLIEKVRDLSVSEIIETIKNNLSESNPENRIQFIFDRFREFLTPNNSGHQTVNQLIKNMSFNLPCVQQFAQETEFPLLKGKLITYVAERKNKFINDLASYEWNISQDQQNIFIPNKNHFDIPSSDAVQKDLRDKLNPYQSVTDGKTTEEKFRAYAEKRKAELERKNIFYIPHHAKNNINDSDESHFDPFKKVATKITWDPAIPNEAVKTIIVHAEPGGGKSSFALQLEQRLLEKFLSTENQPYPLYIKLGDHPEQCFKRALEAIGLSSIEIEQALPFRIIVIFDGFDELSHKVNLSLENNLPAFNTSAVITCRSSHYGSEDTSKFFGSEHSSFYLMPFDDEQIQQYLVARGVTNDDFNFVMNKLSVKELIKNPLLLKLILEILPEIKLAEKDAELTRTDIYEMFIQKSYERYEQELNNHRGVRFGVDIKTAFENYARELASAIHTSSHLNKFKQDDIDTLQAQRATMVASDGNNLAFQHATFLEFYLADVFIDEIESCDFISRFPLCFGCRNLNEDKSLFGFIMDKIKRFPDKDYTLFLHRLLLFVKYTKVNADPLWVMTASNAMTFLNDLELAFSGFNLSGIYLDNADLARGIFNQTDFSHAKIAANFANGYFNETSFVHTDLRSSNFNYYPMITLNEEVHFVHFLSEAPFVLILMGNGRIEIWNYEESEIVFSIQKPTRTHFRSLKISANEQSLAGILNTDDQTVVAYHLPSTLTGEEKMEALLMQLVSQTPQYRKRFDKKIYNCVILNERLIVITESRIFNLNITQRDENNEGVILNLPQYCSLDHFSSDLSRAVCADYDFIYIVDAVTGNILSQHPRYGATFEDIRFSKNPQQLYINHPQSSEYILYDINSQGEFILFNVPAHNHGCYFSVQSLAAVLVDDRLKIKSPYNDRFKNQKNNEIDGTEKYLHFIPFNTTSSHVPGFLAGELRRLNRQVQKYIVQSPQFKNPFWDTIIAVTENSLFICKQEKIFEYNRADKLLLGTYLIPESFIKKIFDKQLRRICYVRIHVAFGKQKLFAIYITNRVVVYDKIGKNIVIDFPAKEKCSLNKLWFSSDESHLYGFANSKEKNYIFVISLNDNSQKVFPWKFNCLEGCKNHYYDFDTHQSFFIVKHDNRIDVYPKDLFNFFTGNYTLDVKTVSSQEEYEAELENWKNAHNPGDVLCLTIENFSYLCDVFLMINENKQTKVHRLNDEATLEKASNEGLETIIDNIKTFHEPLFSFNFPDHIGDFKVIHSDYIVIETQFSSYIFSFTSPQEPLLTLSFDEEQYGESLWDENSRILCLGGQSRCSYWHLSFLPEEKIVATLLKISYHNLDCKNLKIEGAIADARTQKLLNDFADKSPSVSEETVETKGPGKKTFDFEKQEGVLFSISPEILLSMVKFLDYQNRIVLSAVCKQLHNICNDASLSNKFGLLLTTENIQSAIRSEFVFWSCLYRNTFQGELGPETTKFKIKTVPRSAHLLRCSFFCHGKECSYDVPVNLIAADIRPAHVPAHQLRSG